jgi:L-malate glycosyltransferase
MFRINDESYDLKAKLLAAIYRKVYRKFFVIAVSKKIFESHKKNKLFDDVHGHQLVLNGIETTKFCPPAERPSQCRRVIYVSRMEATKGHDTLLDAWVLLKVPYPLELILVGGGSLLPEYQNKIKLSKPAHDVIFTGEKSNVTELLQSSQIAVFPSFREGLPLALLEMMSCGLPVIVSDIPELKELVSNGVNCLTFRAGNQNDLLEKLLLLIGNAELRNTLGQEARAHIEKNYSNKRMRNDYDDIYQKLMGG